MSAAPREMRDFALRVLFDADLATKLGYAPERLEEVLNALTDTAPGPPIQVPSAPGRPPGLELLARGRDRSRVLFPDARDLGSEASRGVVLHFFANHELLAMELMALALLRFPDAPQGFRRGLARTILEEQKHLRLYVDRMKALGVSFGTVPVNRFFWDCLATMATPLEFVAKMSLTLEQANLDFARHFRDVFARVGDRETADILDVVYREEIGHVKHGVVWFNRWRPGDKDDWDEYMNLLGEPMTPARAKGLGEFDRAARASAGLSERFVRELEVYRHSKGRPPVVYWFNPGCEAEIARHAPGPEPKVLRDIGHDLASLMQFLTRADDVVWVDERPTAAFLARVQAAGFSIPQFIEHQDELKGRTLWSVEPWGQSPTARGRDELFRARCLRSKPFVTDWRIFRKTWSASLLAALEPEVAGRIFADFDAVIAFVAAHFRLTSAPLVMKAPLGSSGRNMARIRVPGLSAAQEAWLKGILAAQGEVVVEEWLDRVADLSVQMHVGERRRPVLGVTRFLTDGRGQYVGHKLGRKYEDLEPKVLRALHEDGLLARLEATAQHVAEALAAEGYEGPAGLDALIYRVGDAVRLKAIVEVNPRYTMGRVALELDRHVHHAASATWAHVTPKQVQAFGFADVAAFAAEASTRFPVERLGTTGPLVQGFLPTTDPSLVRVMGTALFVGAASDWLSSLQMQGESQR